MSASESQERARARMIELRASFATRLLERLTRLEALVLQAQNEPANGALAESIGVAHRMAGTAGSYGFVDVGEAAAALERALQRIAGGQDEWEAALASLARIRAARDGASG